MSPPSLSTSLLPPCSISLTLFSPTLPFASYHSILAHLTNLLISLRFPPDIISTPPTRPSYSFTLPSLLRFLLPIHLFFSSLLPNNSFFSFHPLFLLPSPFTIQPDLLPPLTLSFFLYSLPSPAPFLF